MAKLTEYEAEATGERKLMKQNVKEVEEFASQIIFSFKKTFFRGFMWGGQYRRGR